MLMQKYNQPSIRANVHYGHRVSKPSVGFVWQYTANKIQIFFDNTQAIWQTQLSWN